MKYLFGSLALLLVTADSFAQTCPTPELINAALINVNIPADNLPATNLFVSIDNSGQLIFPFGDGLPNSHFVTTSRGSDSVGQIYVADPKLLPNGKFSETPALILNRRTTATGEDIVTVGRFGAATGAGNFVLRISLKYNSSGEFLSPAEIVCLSGKSPKQFDAQYLNVGVPRPSLSLRYFGSLPAARYHNTVIK